MVRLDFHHRIAKRVWLYYGISFHHVSIGFFISKHQIDINFIWFYIGLEF